MAMVAHTESIYQQNDLAHSGEFIDVEGYSSVGAIGVFTASAVCYATIPMNSRLKRGSVPERLALMRIVLMDCCPFALARSYLHRVCNVASAMIDSIDGLAVPL